MPTCRCPACSLGCSEPGPTWLAWRVGRHRRPRPRRRGRTAPRGDGRVGPPGGDIVLKAVRDAAGLISNRHESLLEVLSAWQFVDLMRVNGAKASYVHVLILPLSQDQDDGPAVLAMPHAVSLHLDPLLYVRRRFIDVLRR